MDKLQELTDRLYAEGLSKGKQEGEALLEKARQEADDIISQAKAEADSPPRSRRLPLQGRERRPDGIRKEPPGHP